MENKLTVIWTKFHNELYNYICSRINDKDAAKDILQDSFIKIHKNLLHLKDEKSLRFWIYKIVKNSIMDHYRKTKFNFKSGIDLPEEHNSGDSHITPTEDKTSSLATCIIPFINSLPENYREALLLTEFQNYSQKELASYLGISYSGAKSRVQRAKIKLREVFEKCCSIKSDAYGNIIDYQPLKKCCK